MYVVTFYSYKGGVGRTMALVNVAATLAQRGHRILIVDFDLEAPGISTYRPFAELSSCKGVVDYVADYLVTAVAPRASEFIVQCKLWNAAVWVMPAGARNREYSARLNSIDWQELYSRRSGYLFFEDLKQQWKNQGFDYVLIDSRTGHTDVGGICTRQLPDAVVLMFIPNDQNLLGLESVTSDIREEPRGPRRNDIYLHFCASNVPDLDDEEHILERKLAEAKRRLRYPSVPILIRHYNSLSLLEQSVFVLDRPESRLASEYKSLVEAIISQNLEDAEGAEQRLTALRDQLRSRTGFELDGDPSVRRLLNDIDELHTGNGKIAWIMAHIYSLLGDLESESDRLSVAIDRGVAVGIARRRRAAIAQLQGRPADALSDLEAVLSGTETKDVELSAAIELLREIDTDWVMRVSSSPALSNLDAGARIRLTEVLMTEKRGSELAISLMKGVLENTTGKQRTRALNRLVLALIGLQRFEAAMEQIAKNREEALASEDIVDVFNYAMAEWGKTGIAPKVLMHRVVELSKKDSYPDINWYQCIGLALFVCGEKRAALDAIDRAKSLVNRVSGRAFSCWRYLEVGRSEMRRDLDSLGRLVTGESLQPTVFIPDNEDAQQQLI